MIYVSFLHPAYIATNLDYKSLFHEALDLWVKDQDKWAKQPLHRLYVASWVTNYGEQVALIWARTIDEARLMALDKGAWPGFECEELGVMPEESAVLFVKGNNE